MRYIGDVMYLQQVFLDLQMEDFNTFGTCFETYLLSLRHEKVGRNKQGTQEQRRHVRAVQPVADGMEHRLEQ